MPFFENLRLRLVPEWDAVLASILFEPINVNCCVEEEVVQTLELLQRLLISLFAYYHWPRQ